MTTIAVVRKGGFAAIAADTLTKWGSAKESAEYVVNHEKIFPLANGFIAVTGDAVFKHIVRDYFGAQEGAPKLDNVANIFRTWNRLHADFKERYFLQPEEEKEDAVESPGRRAARESARHLRRVGSADGAGILQVLRLRQRQRLRARGPVFGL